MVNSIAAVPTILDVVCRITGMGFAAVARVTDERWIACSVLDHIKFGLARGGELKLETTICHEIRQSLEAVVINHVDEDEIYQQHPTPRMYGFQSYISMPIILPDQRFFGTLCAIDPKPAKLNTPEIIGMFKMFAELLAFHIDSAEQLENERRKSLLRERLIAVASRDIKDPLTAVMVFSKLLEEEESGSLNAVQREMVSEISKSSDAILKSILSHLDAESA